ncbi:MAG TPA: hypothetical protein VGO93_22645 [Candidatus Xenobia bacterium]
MRIPVFERLAETAQDFGGALEEGLKLGLVHPVDVLAAVISDVLQHAQDVAGVVVWIVALFDGLFHEITSSP